MCPAQTAIDWICARALSGYAAAISSAALLSSVDTHKLTKKSCDILFFKEKKNTRKEFDI